MKKSLLFASLMVVALAISFSFTAIDLSERHENRSLSLYDSIAAMDALWEDAYNNCRLDVMDAVISEDLEFYHDQGGLVTSKQKLNEALKVNICGKVKRKLKEGSLEVYDIKGYGAVEMGLHGFFQGDAPGADLHYSKFVHIWKRNGRKWQITRVISLH